VPISRSQNAFACGHRTGVFSTVRPIAITAASTAGAKAGATVVDEKSLELIAWHNRPELLDGPTGRGVLRHVPMHDPTRTNVQHRKDVQHAEARRDGDEEIAGELAPAWLRTKVLRRWDDRRS